MTLPFRSERPPCGEKGLESFHHHLRSDGLCRTGCGRRYWKRKGSIFEVLDLRSLLPFDREAVLETVKKTSKVILLHEEHAHWRLGRRARCGDLRRGLRLSRWSDPAQLPRRTQPVPFSPPLEELFFFPKVSDVLRVARELPRILIRRSHGGYQSHHAANGREYFRRNAHEMAEETWR
jgi:hypothetical protein